MEFRIVSLFSCFGLILLVSAELVGTVDPPSLFVRKGYPMVVRKLLASLDDDYDSNPNGCTKDDIVIYQGTTSPLPNGIPTYTVQILNVCVSGCAISEIHVNCGWFSSARLINPNVFRRLCYDDCLVNNGEALGPGESLSFQYANSFSYHLSVSSVACS